MAWFAIFYVWSAPVSTQATGVAVTFAPMQLMVNHGSWRAATVNHDRPRRWCWVPAVDWYCYLQSHRAYHISVRNLSKQGIRA